MVESVSQDEAEQLIGETRVLPQSKLFASSAEKYRTEDRAAEALKSGDSVDEHLENPNPVPQNGELKIED